jgi:ABC-type bacteriocin/lantibiotic exporter with double-glycine peptidase domain
MERARPSLRRVTASVARALGLSAGLVALGAGAVAVVEVAFVGSLPRLGDLRALWRLDLRAWLLFGLMLARVSMTALTGTFEARQKERLSAALCRDYVARLLAASPFAPLSIARSALPDELVGDAAAAVGLPFQVLATLVREPLRLFGFVWLLVGAGLELCLFLLLVAVGSALLTRPLNRRLLRIMEQQHAHALTMMTGLRDGIEHQAAWMTAGRRGPERLLARLAEAQARVAQVARQSSRLMAAVQLVLRVTSYAAIFGGTWLVTHVTPRVLSAGQLASFAVAAAWLQAPVAAFVGLRRGWQSTLPSLARLEEILALRALAPAPRETRSLPALTRAITVEEVAFAYAPGRVALTGLSLVLPAGKCIGISGPSGSGKSTLLRLLARLGHPDRGSIRFDDVPLAQLATEDLRALVGVALQPAELVRGSLRDNLRLGRPDADDATLHAALAAVALDSFVAALPEGLDTPLGEGGADVSGGQLVRLGLARLLVTAPPIALVDEPTTALDDATAARVVASLARFAVGRTLCLVSHDPRVLALATATIHLEAGRVADRSAARMEAASAFGPAADGATPPSGRGERP